jgi:hypothetical protein
VIIAKASGVMWVRIMSKTSGRMVVDPAAIDQ